MHIFKSPRLLPESGIKMKKQPCIEKMVRPCCRQFEPYVAGRPVETIRREMGLKKIVKLASNENPLGPSQAAVSAIRQAAAGVYFYPDSNSFLLRSTLAKKHGVAPQQVLLGAGSDELIELVAKVFFNSGDNIVVSKHAFIRYAMAGRLMNARVTAVPMKDYAHDLPAMARAVTPKTKAVFIANPNNPTGTYNTRREFDSFLRALSSRKDCAPLVIVDEAYYEFACVNSDYPDTLSCLRNNPRVIILRTFSKVYGLAGLRCGYGFTSPEVADFMERVRPPFNVNSVAQAACVASLKDRGQVQKSIKLVKEQKAYLYGEMERLGVRYIPTAANFILFDVSPMRGKDVFLALLRRGVIVRAMDEYELPHHVRVSIGLPEENRFFIKCLKEVLK